MSHFTKFISVQLPAIWDPYYTFTEALAYERYYEWSGKFIIIPAWTRTNFASLPWLLTAFWKKDDPRWIKSSIIHDYLWSKATTIKELQEAVVENDPTHIEEEWGDVVFSFMKQCL